MQKNYNGGAAIDFVYIYFVGGLPSDDDVTFGEEQVFATVGGRSDLDKRTKWRTRQQNSTGKSTYSHFLPLYAMSSLKPSASQVASGSVRMSWGNLPDDLTANITAIRVRRGRPGLGYDLTVTKPVPLQTQSHTFDGLTTGTEYVFGLDFVVKGTGSITRTIKSDSITVQY